MEITLLQKFGDDARKTWNVLNTVIKKNNDKSSITESLLINGKIVTDQNEIATKFCDFFTDIGKNYSNAIPKSNFPPEHFMQNVHVLQSVYLSPTNPTEVCEIIMSLKSKKSCGDDGISIDLLKNTSSYISLPLSAIINMSLEQGVVPDKMKIAKVIPVYKSKGKENVCNYRPISLLSNISKIIEKIVYKRLFNFLTQHNVLYESQWLQSETFHG